LICILGLSILLVGCGGDSTGMADTGGTSGMGGTAGMGGGSDLSGDACLDDLGVLGDIDDITALVTDQCLLGNRGCAVMDVPPCTAQCLEEEVALPQDCGFCIGLVTECILGECIGDCLNPDSTECSSCIAAVSDQCNEVFEPCGGFPVP
jgi:hypothetical protein